MDRLRRLRTSKKNDQGDQHVSQEKYKSKLPSSSLVARLMRFNGLKSQKPIPRQHKSFVEHNLLRTSPVALQEDAHSLGGKSDKKRFTEQPECKDIFEDIFTKSGSNKDAILELLEKPNPLFLKHLQGVQESSSSSLCSHLPIPKHSNLEIYEAKDQNVGRNTSKEHNIGSKKTHENGILSLSSTLSSTRSHPRPSKNGGEVKEVTNTGTSRIVILKPNYAMAREAPNSLSSHDPSRVKISGSRKDKGKMNELTTDEDFVDGIEVSASRVREDKRKGKKVIRESSETARIMKETEAKEASKRFNRDVQEVFTRMRINFPSYVREIPGTGGLHDFSRIDSASESEVMKMTSYDSTESLISIQAKKRLLERWRRAQRNEHVRASRKYSTLGEMLCIPEEELTSLDASNARWDSPLGISSADGWAEKYSKIKPRSLPPLGTRNEELYAEHIHRTDDKLLMSKEARYRSQSDTVHGNFTEKEDFSSKNSRSSKRKSQSRHRRASNSHALLESHISCYDTDLMKNDSPEEKSMVPPPTVTSTSGTGASTTVEYLTASSTFSDACYPDISRSMLERCDSSGAGQEHSDPKHLDAEVEPSGRSKEADPGPISVLEVTSREDVSSGPEQFSADLHDLRKQLSLLSRESKTIFDAPLHIETDFNGEGSGLAANDEDIVVSECWESFYIADVLIECGLYDLDTYTFMPSFKGPNHPLGLWVFHNLEKKYCNEMSAPKYERMLLFDRIRSAVLEISQSCMSPWVKPVTTELGLKWPKCELRNELHKLLAIQDTEVKEVISGKVIDKVTYWGDLNNSVDMIGTKIEWSLTNDLLMELVLELQFDV